ncbi:Transcriptional regulator, AraC family [Arcticibacter svalbardensis MN12-7]|uniref:Transcriptional regulator, AraC family n=1 Tax=Arcticibacter svalbardensis MN12-7 TaxID=1150600 RepID=R9GX04_9SPHI|nr:SDR family NAD(P)-dependent oxidoreductase [Arcticibacter svalbardensis]EOR96158.1 Transcriptional regulator, AraC family [Arcticibacter svalbardensis MN12-7]
MENNTNRIKGKVIAITGASSGIGEATAMMLAELGAKVVLGARRLDRLEELDGRIRAVGGDSTYLVTAVKNRVDVDNLVKLACQQYGRLDVIINNAGISHLSRIDELQVEEWEEMIDVNLKGVLYGIAAGLSVFNELDNNIDSFSQDVLVSQIELILIHSNRFYTRQFNTRKTVYIDLIDTMNAYLDERFDPERSVVFGLPTVQEVSDHLHISARYLTDLLKSLTGQSTQQHIHNKLIEKAKDRLSTSRLTIAEIAYQLGFEHPQSFNKLFKRYTEISPTAYRQSFN